MKKILNTFLLSTLLFTSCNKFLDVQPRSQIELEKMFEDEIGFQDALTGVYIQMVSEDTYGQKMTQTTIENLVSSWDVTSGSVEEKLGLFAYSDAQSDEALSAIFSGQYKTIASVNAILNNIDERKSVFKTPGLYELIKGEALAIRAFVHLDILRLFGPQPMNSGIGNKLAYVTEFSKSLKQHVSYEEYTNLIINDIQQAVLLLKEVDPILHYSVEELRNQSLNLVNGDANSFFTFRTYRMNYFAVKSLEARAQLWIGNIDKAYSAALEIVQAKNGDGTQKFPLGQVADFAKGDYGLRNEQMFGLYDRTKYNWFQTLYSSGLTKKGTTVTTIRTSLFGNTDSDIRLNNLWTLITLANNTKAHIINKYNVKDPSSVSIATDYNQIPILRISEMYLILSETASFSEAKQYFQQFRISRGLNIADPIDEPSLKSEIVKEYRKEFYGEGQSFFVYKRNNTPSSAFLFIPKSASINYILPLPSVEKGMQ